MGGLEAKAILFLVIVALSAAGGGILVHKIDAGRYAKLELSIARANEEALQQAITEQKRLATVDRVVAEKEAQDQRQLANQARANLDEVQRHVKADRTHCVNWGLVRVLDAAAQGVTADSLPAPGGKPDAACAPTDAVALARAIVNNYFAALANAKQLDALIANLKARQ